MATFTTTVRKLIQQRFDFGLTKDDYPIFDERWRGWQDETGLWRYTFSDDGTMFYGLNAKILDHFMYREIGQETAEMFRHMLNRRMREIMPYYNQLYKTEYVIENPFTTLEMEHVTDSRTVAKSDSEEHNASKNESTTEGKARNVNSTFPQTRLMPDGDYASSAADSFSESKVSADADATIKNAGTNDVKGDTKLTMVGSQGSRGRLLEQYRSSIINVDLMILADLEPLFMGVENTVDNYTRRDFNGPHASWYWPYF